MRLAVVETRFFGDEKMMPIIVSTWVDIARRYVDESFAKAIHAIMGTCYEEQNADTDYQNLKQCDLKSLKNLAQEIRSFILESSTSKVDT